jgi:hypothetical protein
LPAALPAQNSNTAGEPWGNSHVKISSITASLLLVGAQTAAAQECESLLNKDILINQHSDDTRMASYHWACSHNFHEFQQQYGDKSSASFMGFGGGNEFTESKYEIWRASNCQTNTSDEHRSSFDYYYSKATGQVLADAYVECIRLLHREQLICSAEAQGDAINFVIDWEPSPVLETRISNILIRGGSVLGGGWHVNDPVSQGIKRIAVQPMPGNKGVSLVINLNYGANLSDGGAGRSCKAFVAPPLPQSQIPTVACKGATAIATAMYLRFLDRAPDPSGLTNAVAQIASHVNNVKGIVQLFLMSREFKNKYIKSGKEAEAVTTMYQKILGRDPDPDGKRNSIKILMDGHYDDLVENFLSSPEYNVNFDSNIVPGMQMKYCD